MCYFSRLACSASVHLACTCLYALQCRFVFKDQYIELTTQLPPDADLYGLGEVTLPTGLRLPRNGTVITLWNRDLSASEPHVNLYSSHAFYLQVRWDVDLQQQPAQPYYSTASTQQDG